MILSSKSLSLIDSEPTCGQLRLHHITRTRQFGDHAVNVAFLLFQPLDASPEFRKRTLDLGHRPAPETREVEHPARDLNREADLLARQHVGGPRAVAPRIEPLLATPRRI